jgi:hypothetical protein
MKIYFHAKGTKETKNCAESLLSPALVLHKFVEEREPILSATWVNVVFAVMGACGAFAQGTFQNLDFESASLMPVAAFQGGYVPASEALPDWIVYIGGQQQIQVLQNQITTGAPSVDILTPTSPTGNGGIIDGNDTVVLQAGYQDGITPETASISQTGFGSGGNWVFRVQVMV